MIYHLFVSLHIIFAGIWIVNFISDSVLKKNIYSAANPETSKKLIGVYLNFVNILGIIGSMGILITGIYLVSTSGAYGFFDFSSNHWLVTKQLILIIILVLIFAFVIPTAKKVRTEAATINSVTEISSLKKMFKINLTINILVTINLLLALSRMLFVS